MMKTLELIDLIVANALIPSYLAIHFYYSVLPRVMPPGPSQKTAQTIPQVKHPLHIPKQDFLIKNELT